MKPDILNRADIEKLVIAFYDKVKADDVIGFIFNNVAKVNWHKHLPVMFNFWENVLFYAGSYSGNPTEVHQHLHKMFPLNKAHFAQWNKLFVQTVDELFEGTNANMAKQRAVSISTVMQMKVLDASAL